MADPKKQPQQPPVEQRVSDLLSRGSNAVIPGRAPVGQILNEKIGDPMTGQDPTSAGGQFTQSLIDFINTLFAANVGQPQQPQQEQPQKGK